MKKKALAAVVVVIVLVCFVTIIQKNRTYTQEYEPSIEITTKKSCILFGQSAITGDNVPVGVYI